MIRASELNRVVLIRRAIASDDGLSSNTSAPTAVTRQPGDLKRAAKRTDASDGERIRASQNGVTISTRFLVRWEPEIAALTSEDVLICDDEVFHVVGAKEARGRYVGIEITTSAKPFTPGLPA